LLEAGANTEARDQTGNTALHRAMGRFIDEAPQIVEALIAAGADVRARNGQGQLAIDLIADHSPLQGTDAYWQVNEGRFD
jgi:ankyrin repeat protein